MQLVRELRFGEHGEVLVCELWHSRGYSENEQNGKCSSGLSSI